MCCDVCFFLWAIVSCPVMSISFEKNGKQHGWSRRVQGHGELWAMVGVFACCVFLFVGP